MDRTTDQVVAPIGVGIDTARYGHRVTFLRADLQPAAGPLTITESRDGYNRLQQALERLNRRQPGTVFHIRLDEAGQYAANLEAFLRSLPLEKSISVGDPVRNKNYRVAHFPKRKSDDVESYSVARFAVLEQPTVAGDVPAELRALRDVAGRLESQTREVTRHINQLHNLLARVFPELATIVRDIGARFVLELLKKYPTPARMARARLSSLEAIPHMRKHVARRIHEAASTSIACVTGETAETLVESLVEQVCFSQKQRRRFGKLLEQTYGQLPESNHLETIGGIGIATAAVLTAKIISIDRFERPEQLVGYFGIFPEERSSGVTADGKPHRRRSSCMSKKGNALVRYYLYNAAMAAVRCNPAARALYRRLRAKGTSGNAALGHVMRKLLHLVFAVWNSGKPFDPNHHPWEQQPPQTNQNQTQKAAGHKQEACPDQKVVTAAQTSKVRTKHDAVNSLSDARDGSTVRRSNSQPASEAPPERSNNHDAVIPERSLEKRRHHR